MPLDSGEVTHLLHAGGSGPGDPLAPTEEPSLSYGPDIGAALKAAREFRGLSIQDVADATRIRRTYLSAVEDMRLEELPSRPFAIGYVKAYAKLLGLDPDEAVARFKAEAPEPDELLRAPSGVRHERDPRMGMIMGGGALIVSAILIWNVAQRAISEEAPPPPTAPQASVTVTPVAPTGPMTVGAPLPTPTEASTPPVYQTPGLEAAAQAGGSADAAAAAAKARKEAEAGQAAALSDTPIGTPFVAKGTIHGAPATGSMVTLQARRQTMLIVRGPDNAIYFARSLPPGEAYRLPTAKGLTVEVTDPQSMDVFVSGRFKGWMPTAQATVAALVG
ncbi:MAG: helix-turn-helix domain-containing protein [Pseudomonadota bacterium]